MSGFEVNKIEALIGQTCVVVEQSSGESSDVLRFVLQDGRYYDFYYEHYEPDCCADCHIEDVCGNLNDLVGSPIIEAEERIHSGESGCESTTWTFYAFATAKGAVTVRWIGSSNGYYSESVSHGFTGNAG